MAIQQLNQLRYQLLSTPPVIYGRQGRFNCDSSFLATNTIHGAMGLRIPPVTTVPFNQIKIAAATTYLPNLLGCGMRNSTVLMKAARPYGRPCFGKGHHRELLHLKYKI